MLSIEFSRLEISNSNLEISLVNFFRSSFFAQLFRSNFSLEFFTQLFRSTFCSTFSLNISIFPHPEWKSKITQLG